MNTSTRILTFLLFISACDIDARAQSVTQSAQTPKIELRVLFLGTAADGKGDTAGRAARTRAFADFLGREFSSVRVAARDGFDPKSVGDAEVVLLDWSQSEVDISKMGEIKSPLGPREAWDRPTVLLGSAGLLLAGPWQLKGSYG